MKKGILNIGIIALALLCSLGSIAQPSIPEGFCDKQGKENIGETKKNYSLYKEYHKQENYDKAKKFWLWMLENAPAFHEVVVMDGAVMYEAQALAQEDPTRKQELIDTLMLLYDMRALCFGTDKAAMNNVAIRKAYSASEVYGTKDWEKLQVIYKNTIDKLGVDAPAFILSSYFATQYSAHKKDLIDCDGFLNIGDMLMELSNQNIEAGKDVEDYEGVNQYIESSIPSECLTCESLTSRYTAAFDSKKSDVEWLEKAMSRLYHKGCSSQPIYAQIKDALCGLQPSAVCYRKDAEDLLAAGNYDGAVAKLNEAIALEGDLNKKAKDVLNQAKIYQKAGQFGKARETAKTALQYRGNWGEVYMFIGNLYAGSGAKCGGSSSINGVGVAWVAYDMYAKAKSIDPSVAEKAQKGMNRMAAYFPKLSDMWKFGVQEGDSVTIGCWIGASTRARSKK